MSRQLRLYLSDILTSIAKIQNSIKGHNQDYFLENEIIFDGIILNLQIIGESAKNIPQSIREKYPQIDWKSLIGLRNIIAHTYFTIDPDIIWDIAKTELEPLKNCIELIQQNENLE